MASTDYAFILIDTPQTRSFASDILSKWYPGASITFLSSYTRGAALSALAGIAGTEQLTAPLIVDLADILYESTLDPAEVFASQPDCGGIALTFKADNPVYSYLRTDASGTFVEAAEKRVISDNASAGTYIFRDCSTYLRAVAHAINNAETQTFRDLFYVCPLFNGVRDQGKEVVLEPVRSVIDIKTGSN